MLLQKKGGAASNSPVPSLHAPRNKGNYNDSMYRKEGNILNKKLCGYKLTHHMGLLSVEHHIIAMRSIEEVGRSVPGLVPGTQ